MKRNIMLMGNFGAENLGDNAFLLIAVNKIKKNQNYNKIVVASNRYCSFLDTDKIMYIKKSILSMFFYSLSCKDIVLCGGTHFHDDMQGNKYLKYFLYFFFFLLLRLTMKRVILMGIGIGPLNNLFTKTIIKMILKFSNFVSIRDSKSLEYCGDRIIRKNKAIKTFDLAVLLDNKENEDNYSEETTIKIGFSVFPYWKLFKKDQNYDRKFIDELVQQITSVNSMRNIEIVLFLVNGMLDVKNTQYFFSMLREHKVEVKFIEYTENPKTMLAKMNRCHFFVGSKLHFSVFSYILNKPQILLSYHEKCTAFAKEVGIMEEFIFNIERINFTQLKSQILKIIDNYSSIKQFFYSYDLKEAKKEAFKNFRWLNE